MTGRNYHSLAVQLKQVSPDNLHRELFTQMISTDMCSYYATEPCINTVCGHRKHYFVVHYPREPYITVLISKMRSFMACVVHYPTDPYVTVVCRHYFVASYF